MRSGNWLIGFMALGSSLGVGAAILLCSLAALALGELPAPVAGQFPFSGPVLIVDAAAVAPEEGDRCVVYELDGRYYHVQPKPTLGRTVSSASPVSALSAASQGTRAARPSRLPTQPKVYVAEDSEGFLAVVVSSAGDVRVSRRADGSFVTD